MSHQNIMLKNVSLWITLSLLLLSGGCQKPGETCAKCGMQVNDHPRWIAGLTTPSGMEKRFCSPRCMFAWFHGSSGKGSQKLWVTEYYNQAKMPVSEVHFVMGSDVIGPMGKTLTPIAAQSAAEKFMEDHHGSRILSHEEITMDLLKTLKQASSTSE